MPRMCGSWIRRVLLLVLTGSIGCLPGGGCSDWGYLTTVAVGELGYLAQAEPIESALVDPTLTDEQREKLQLVIAARDYAELEVGLRVGDSYREFVNLNDEGLAWNVSGSRKDAFEPYMWHLPIAGPIPYIGFFYYEAALAERDRLVELDYDTMLYEVDAFSTLGLLPDPASSSILRRSIPSLADTVIHELLHNTIWSGQDTTYSESLATFVGRTASVEFLEHYYGPESEYVEHALMNQADGDRLNQFFREMYEDLEALYQSGLGYEQIMLQREDIFEAHRRRFRETVQPQMARPELYAAYGDLSYNNAFLMLNVRYNRDLDLYEQVFDHLERDWPAALAVFRTAAGQNDPSAYLQQWLEERGNEQ